METPQYTGNNPNYSTFNFSHTHKTTMDMGELVPICTIPTLPDDEFDINGIDAFIRGMPTIAPIMDKVDIKINHFYVPYRVLWEQWQDFFSRNNTHTLLGETVPTFPVCYGLNKSDAGVGGKAFGRLGDYLGMSKYAFSNFTAQRFSAMPFLAYQKIFMDYYVPQRWVHYMQQNGTLHPLVRLKANLEKVRKGPGGDLGAALTVTFDPMGSTGWLGRMQTIDWSPDYFTSALPSPEMFDGSKMLIQSPDDSVLNGTGYFSNPTDGMLFKKGTTPGEANYNRLPTIRDLRKSIATQHYLENLSYGGGLYMETLQIIWGSKLKNDTLIRSQYIGGDAFSLFTNEVEQTATTAQGSLGDLAGKPVAGGSTNREYFVADEHGIYMVMAHIVPKRSYSDAISKPLWMTHSIDDFPSPEFEGIGDEPLFNYELNGKSFDPAFASANKVFGWVPKYSSWKTHLDRFSGEMTSSLKHWHLGESADTLINFDKISPEFMKCNPRTDIFKVPSEPDKFLGTFHFNIKVKRKLTSNPTAGMHKI